MISGRMIQPESGSSERRFCYEYKQIYKKFTSGGTGCEKLAYDYGNQEIAQEHLLYALVTQNDSLILKLLEKWGIREHSLSIVWKRC